VAAAREQAEERRLHRLRLEVERGDVSLEMVDRSEGDATRPCECLRRPEPHEERAHEPRPLRDRDPVDPLERGAGRVERLAHDRGHELEVPAGRDLGDDPSVSVVELRLRGHDRREHPPVVGDDRSRRLVARRLERENHEAFSAEAGSRHMMSASSRLSV
jgi:hypothetical protein